ncbi:hypothetical protein WS71_10060 [Burkholderia mayonis]|uniref:Uncharacterized protein n=1 Tax=Burkholderia mayonis TaxID=1385591 RepID=A0A1B4FVA6_9BURK|nr:hypothetical protein WS71_10060 [Burkholderia mayonis]KVE58332.1 hypothetical protein WS71_24595 [Burkholderia mayonis]
MSPSENDCEAVARTALEVAWKALAQLREESDIAANVATRSILSAFAAVIDAERTADKEFKARNPGRDCHGHHVDAHHIVATALTFADSLDSSVHPHSVAGARVLSFAAACKALDAHAAMKDALDEPPGLYGAHSIPDLLKLSGTL